LAFECKRTKSGNIKIIKTLYSNKCSANLIDDFKDADDIPKLDEIIAKYKDKDSTYAVVLDYDLIAPSEVYQMIFLIPNLIL